MATSKTKTDKKKKEQPAPASSSSRSSKRKRSRWGDASKTTDTAAAATVAAPAAAAVATAASATTTTTTTTDDAKAKVLSMQESIKARLAAAKAKQQQQQQSTTKTAAAPTEETARPTKRAKHYKLDMSVTKLPTAASQQVKQKSKLKIGAQQQKPQRPSNPYLAHTVEYDKEEQQYAMVEDDPRLQRTTKRRTRHREFNFVEPGKYEKLAEKKRDLAKAVEAAGFVSGRKTGHTVHSLAQVYGPSTTATSTTEDIGTTTLTVEELPLRTEIQQSVTSGAPLTLEWWDVEALLPSKLRKQVAAAEHTKLTQQMKLITTTTTTSTSEKKKNETEDGNKEPTITTSAAAAAAAAAANTEVGDTTKTGAEGSSSTEDDLLQRCLEHSSLSYSKTAALVQHIVPIQPPTQQAAGGGGAATKKQPPQAVLHLTHKERKRQRKLRRQAKQRELQDLQAAGLVPAPEPRLTLSNFIKVLGDQAVLDPSQMEQKVMEQMQARQRAHYERNQTGKLTKEQRAAKKASKLQEDTSESVSVAIFAVTDMSHPYHRTKVDLNAQQNYITGTVIECASSPQISCVIVEGGPKAIKRYERLMLVRMKWTGPDDAVEDDEEEGEPATTMQVDGGDDDDDDAAVDAEPVVQHKFNPNNKCVLVWKGMAVKRLFKSFVFQACETSDQARKILKAKGVGHYWDQVLQQQLSLSSSSGQLSNKLRLAATSTPAAEMGAAGDQDDVDETMEDA